MTVWPSVSRHKTNAKRRVRVARCTAIASATVGCRRSSRRSPQASTKTLGRREPPVESLAQRLGHALALAVHPGDPRAPSVDVLLQPADLVLVVRFDLLVVLVRPARRDAKIGDLGVLGLDPAFQRFHSPRRGLRCGGLELEPAGVEPLRQRVRERTGVPLRPAQFLAAQLRHSRATPFHLDARLCLFKQRRSVERLGRRRRDGKRPQGVAALGRRQVGAEIRVGNRHARDGSACAE